MRRSPLKTPYSFSLSPRSRAIARRRMLCAFEPVKYWSAAPNDSGGTTRRSTCTPDSITMLAFVPPAPRTRRTSGSFVNAPMILPEAGAGDEDVNVADRLAHAPQTAGGDRALDAALFELRDDLLDQRQRLAEQHPPRSWPWRTRWPRGSPAAFFAPMPGSSGELSGCARPR